MSSSTQQVTKNSLHGMAVISTTQSRRVFWFQLSNSWVTAQARRSCMGTAAKVHM